MSSVERWNIWHPLKSASGDFRVHSFVDVLYNFEIYLFNEVDQRIIFGFGESVLGYRVSQEICTMQTQAAISARYGDDFLTQSIFFKVTNSMYIKELDLEDTKKQAAQHFVFFDIDSMVDVIAMEEPAISWS